jgi:hypothetical protein
MQPVVRFSSVDWSTNALKCEVNLYADSVAIENSPDSLGMENQHTYQLLWNSVVRYALHVH